MYTKFNLVEPTEGCGCEVCVLGSWTNVRGREGHALGGVQTKAHFHTGGPGRQRERGGDILYLAQEEVPQIPPIRFHPVFGPSQLCVQISPLVS